MDDAKIFNVLKANQSKNFVQRILEPDKYPTLSAGEGSYATHKMAWGEEGGKYYVFPTVVYDGENLKELDPRSAFEQARKTGERIEFDNPRDANEFSKRYKRFWEKDFGKK